MASKKRSENVLAIRKLKPEINIRVCIGIIGLLSGLSGYAFAQQQRPMPSLDEIQQQFEELESEDEILRAYVEIGNSSFRNNPQLLLQITEKINGLEHVDVETKKAFISFLKANAWRLMNADSTIYYADLASGKLLRLEEHDSYLMMENLRAMQYTRKDQFLLAESLYLNAIEYRKKLEDKVEYPIQYFYGNLGNLYAQVGVHDLAIQMYEKLLTYEDNIAARCNTLSRLAGSFIELDDLDQALNTLLPCLEVENLPPPIKSTIRANLSTIYAKKGDEQQMLYFLEQASAISTQHRVPNISNSQLVRLGKAYLSQNMLSKADSVKQLMEKPVIPYSRPNEEILKNEFFTELAIKKGNYAEGIVYADNAINIAKQNNLTKILRDIYAHKAVALSGLRRFEEALAAQQEQERLLSEKIAAERSRNLEMMKVRYQLQNKDEQLQEANLEVQNLRLVSVLVMFFLIMIVSYVFYRYRLHYLLKEERTRNRIARDLHDDLSGTLSSISFFSEAAQRTQKNPDQSARFLTTISKSAKEAKEKINDIIWAIDPSKDDWSVFLKKCKRFAADLLDSHDISYEFDIDENFDFPVELEVRQNLWLIFKECVINLNKYSEATKAHISIKQLGNSVVMKIQDNGKGFNPEESKNGNGIKNIKHRAEAIQGTSELITEVGKGTTWSFVFKLK